VTTFFWIPVHILILNTGLGWSILTLWQRNHDRNAVETAVSATLLGFYIETLFIGTLIFIGIPFVIALRILIAITLISIVITLFTVLREKKARIRMPNLMHLRWYEWLLGFSLVEKASFALWQLTHTFVWADDALNHWCGRGRCLFSGINWSMDPNSPVFLGFTSNAKNYPLGVVIWRAVTARLNGSWNDILARADNLLCFFLLTASVWLIVYRASKRRYLAAIGAFIISVLPFQAWHAAIGYSDIAVEVFVVAALAALLRK